MNHLLTELTAQAARLKLDAYLVGGGLRDRLLSKSVRDFDVAVEGDAAALARGLADAVGGAFVVLDAARQIYRVVAGSGEQIDFTTIKHTLEHDLQARDFTVNALALPLAAMSADLIADWDNLPPERIEPLVLDYVHGLDDLRARRIRHLGERVFVEDPVRVLRAARLAAGLGFELAPETATAVRLHAHLLRGAAGERLRDELLLLLEAPDCVGGITLAHDLGVLDVLIPELSGLENLEQPPPHHLDAWHHTLAAVQAAARLCADTSWAAPYAEVVAERLAAQAGHGHPRSTFLLLGALLHDIGKPETRSRDADGVIHFYHHTEIGAELAADIARRLRLSGREAARLRAIVRGHLWPTLLAGEEEVTDRAIFRLVQRLGDAALDTLVVAIADRGGKVALTDAESERHREVVRRMLDRLFSEPARSADRPLVTGREIMERYGLEQGPMIGALLEALVEAQQERRLTDPEEAWAVLDELVRERGL